MKCTWHLCENQAVDYNGKGKFCCQKCKNKYYVDKRRKDLKKQAIDYKGGICVCCGYQKSCWALDFHHIDPSKKDFGISKSGHTKSWDRIKQELDKCILVCKNCHAEIHHGVRELPRLDLNQEKHINSVP